MPISEKLDARNQRLKAQLDDKLRQEKNIQAIAGADAKRQKRMNELLDKIRPLDAQLKAIDAQLAGSKTSKPLLEQKRKNVAKDLLPLQKEYNKLAKEQSQIPPRHQLAMREYDKLVDEIQLLKLQLGLK